MIIIIVILKTQVMITENKLINNKNNGATTNVRNDKTISTSNHKFGKAIWNKFPEWRVISKFSKFTRAIYAKD